MTAPFRFVAPAIALVALVTTVAPAGAQYGATNGEWSSYAGDNGGTKYSPLDQVDAGNFSSLEIVWRVPTPDGQLDFEAITEDLVRRRRLGEDPGGNGNPDYGLSLRLFKATPLMVDGLLYVPTPLSLGAAYDAGTGENVWVHDPESYLNGPPASRSNMRGAAYWSDGEIERVYWGTTDGYLLSVDARTGEPATEFGDNGRVDLFTGVPRAERGTYNRFGRNWISVTSPPIVSNGVVVTPVTITDYVIAKEAPPGWVKGIDARTGELRWV
nr:PQQ-binding-like beta-propeller repeat protein [Acidimicrobiales bacterium]